MRKRNKRRGREKKEIEEWEEEEREEKREDRGEEWGERLSGKAVRLKDFRIRGCGLGSNFLMADS